MFDASVCHDKAAAAAGGGGGGDAGNEELAHRQGLLRCRLALGELTSAMDLANSMVQQRCAKRFYDSIVTKIE